MNTSTTTFYIVRHGESEHNVKKQFGLVPESELSQKGEQQAIDLAKKFQNIHFDLAISSDFVRTKRTAEIITLEKKLAIRTSEFIRERSYGRLNGKTEAEIRDELKELYDEYLGLSDKEKFTYKLVDDMESTEEALSRTLVYLRELAIVYRDKTILIVSHTTIMRGLLIHLGFADYHEIDRDCIANTAYMKLESDGIDFFLTETLGIKKKS